MNFDGLLVLFIELYLGETGHILFIIEHFDLGRFFEVVVVRDFEVELFFLVVQLGQSARFLRLAFVLVDVYGLQVLEQADIGTDLAVKVVLQGEVLEVEKTAELEKKDLVNISLSHREAGRFASFLGKVK